MTLDTPQTVKAVSIHALMRVRLRGGYGTDYQQCNGRFAPTSHGRYKDSRP